MNQQRPSTRILQNMINSVRKQALKTSIRNDQNQKKDIYPTRRPQSFFNRHDINGIPFFPE